MLESIVMLLIYVCVVAIAVYLVIWVLEMIGLSLPPIVLKILWVIFALIVILMLSRILVPMVGHGKLLSLTKIFTAEIL